MIMSDDSCSSSYSWMRLLLLQVVSKSISSSEIFLLKGMVCMGGNKVVYLSLSRELSISTPSPSPFLRERGVGGSLTGSGLTDKNETFQVLSSVLYPPVSVSVRPTS